MVGSKSHYSPPNKTSKRRRIKIMSKAIETVLNNTEVTAQEYFELVNQFDYSSIVVQIK